MFDAQTRTTVHPQVPGGGGNGYVSLTARGTALITVTVRCLPGSFYWTVPDARTLRKFAAEHAANVGARLIPGARRTERNDGPVGQWTFVYDATLD